MKNLLPSDYAWMSILLSEPQTTRYVLLQKSNQLLQYIHPPLKAGAFYPRLLNFERQKYVNLFRLRNEKWLISPTPQLKTLFEDTIIHQGISYLDNMPIFWHIVFRSLLWYKNECLIAKFLSLSQTRLFALRSEIENDIQKTGDCIDLFLATNFERLQEVLKIQRLIGLKKWQKPKSVR